MPRISLKATIGSLTAVTVILVAGVCLGITLTVSLSAIRDMGKGNAEALVKGAHANLQQHFTAPAQTALYIRERAIAERWVYPTYHPQANASLYNDIAALACKDATLLHRESTGRMNFFWLDGSRSSARISLDDGSIEVETMTGDDTSIFLNGTRHYFNLTNSKPLLNQPVNPTPYVNSKLTGLLDAVVNYFGTDNTSAVWIDPVLVNSIQAGIEINYPLLVPIQGGLANPNHLAAVLYFAIRASTLTAILQDIKATPNTESMLYDATRLVIAATVKFDFDNGTMLSSPLPRGTAIPEGCLLSGARDSIRCLPYIANLSVAAFDAVAADASFLFNRGEPVVQLVEAGGAYSYVAQAHVKKPFAGNDLFVMLQVPEEDVIGDVVKGRNLAIGLSCAILVVAVAVAVALIFVLLAPLSEVAERMSYAATLEDDLPAEGRSAMAEIAELEDAYERMNTELQRLKAFVPQSLLRAAQADDDVDLDLDTSLNRSGDVLNLSRSRRSGTDDTGSIRDTGDTRSVATRGNAGSGVFVASGGLNTSTSLKRQRVTVLCLNSLGFNTACADRSFGDTVAAVAATVEAVSTAVQEHRGVVDSFHGDRFTATFNAVHGCPGHQRKAVHCALRLARELAALGFKLTPTAGVASGEALVGNVGSATMKHFCVLGPALPQASMLERLAKLYPDAAPHVLVTGRVAADVASNVSLRPVDIVRLPGRTRPTVVSVALGEVEEGAAGGEWLYVLEKQGAGVAGTLGAAFEQAAGGTREEARAIVATVKQQLAAEGGGDTGGENTTAETAVSSGVTCSIKRLIAAVCDGPEALGVCNTYGALHAAATVSGFARPEDFSAGNPAVLEFVAGNPLASPVEDPVAESPVRAH